MFRSALALPLVLAAVAGPAFADISVHAGNHTGFGRLVFDLGPSATWELSRGAGENTIELDQAYPIGPVPALPRNFGSVSVDGSSLHVTLKQGASLRVERIRGLLVLDAVDPPSVGPRMLIADAQPAPAAPVLLSPPPDRRDTQPPALARDSALPAPILSLQPTRLHTDSGATTSIVIPFDPGVGAAAFETHGTLAIVFDCERPIDVMDLRQDPVFGQATAHTFPGATILRLPLAPDAWPALQRDSGGWRISITHQPSPAPPIAYTTSASQLLFSVLQPGHVVKILNPTTGAAMLVGTVRGPSAAVRIRSSTPQFLLLPTILGVAVEPLSDRLTLEERPGGFALSVQDATLALTPESPELIAQADAAGLTTRFEISPEPESTLFRQMRSQMEKAALAPPLTRGPLQREVARTMIALGMGPEAEAMLRLAALQDPREAEVPDHNGLAAMAAILAYRSADSDALQSQDLSGTDEVTLWRALRDLETDQAQAAGPGLAATWPIILSYGASLRTRLLPLAAEGLIDDRQLAAAQALVKSEPDAPELALARGMLAEAQGDYKAALSTYDALAHRPDPLVRVRAARRAIDLRLAQHMISEPQAADALDGLVAAWHGGSVELNLREQLSDLRAKTGQWQKAFDELRSLENDFPTEASAIRERRRQLFAAFLASSDAAKLDPLNFLTLVQSNTDVQPDGDAGAALQSKLVDRLLALDLNDQAASVLDRLMQTAGSDQTRAEYGARLAKLRLHGRDAPGAIKALAASNASDLAPALTARRALLSAQALAAEGKVSEATDVLRPLNTPESDRALADILERTQDWPGAEHALADLVVRTVPASGVLTDDQKRTLLDLATAMTRAGDSTALSDLRTRQLDRMGTGPVSDLFRVLTSQSVNHVADLPQAAKDLGLERSLTGELKAIR